MESNKFSGIPSYEILEELNSRREVSTRNVLILRNSTYEQLTEELRRRNDGKITIRNVLKWIGVK